MKRILGLISVWALVLSVLCSCTALIEFDVSEEEPVLVVYGAISNDSQTHLVSVNSSGAFFNPKPITDYDNAEVRIEIRGDEYYGVIETSKSRDPADIGVYRANKSFSALVDHTYSLRISFFDYEDPEKDESYVITEKCLPKAAFTEITIVPEFFLGGFRYHMNISGLEPLGPNYYVCHVWVNGYNRTRNLSNFYTFSDKDIDGQELDNELVSTFWSPDHPLLEYMSPDEIKTLPLFYPGDEVMFRIGNVSEGYYRFVTESQKSLNTGNPMFGGPPSNIYSNIPRGIGYFTAFSFKDLKATVPETQPFGRSMSDRAVETKVTLEDIPDEELAKFRISFDSLPE